MSDRTFPDAANEVESITPKELKHRIEHNEAVTILDTRAENEFDEWQIQYPNVTTVNYPYFQLLDGIPDDLHDLLPSDQQITVLCAKGGASEFVADHLNADGYDADHLEDGMNGWARLYESVEIPVDFDATIIQYQRPSSGCLAYLLISGSDAVVIDPLRAFADRYIEDARDRGAAIKFVLDTHIHADHISGVRAIADQTDGTIMLPEPAADRGVTYEQDFDTVIDGNTLSFGEIDLEVIYTPGHTTGMTAYAAGNVLFTGDGLFTDSVARPDLEDPEAARKAAQTLYDSLTETVLSRPADTIIAPAHHGPAASTTDNGTYTATLGNLQASMPALSMDAESFVEFIVSDLPPRPANYETIIETNLGQTAVDDDEAFALELGPNNCAATEEPTAQ